MKNHRRKSSGSNLEDPSDLEMGSKAWLPDAVMVQPDIPSLEVMLEGGASPDYSVEQQIQPNSMSLAPMLPQKEGNENFLTKYTFGQGLSNQNQQLSSGDDRGDQNEGTMVSNQIVVTSMQNVIKESRYKYRLDSTGGQVASRLAKMQVQL